MRPQLQIGGGFTHWPSRRQWRAFGWAAAILAMLAVATAMPSDRAWAQDKKASAKTAASEAAYNNPQQAALLKQQISALKPQRKGATDIYAIGLAGWATEDVFRKELDGALASIGKALPLNGGAVRLINHPETVQAVPLATHQNFAAAVHSVGQIMDKEEDVLVVFMTSHGSPEGFGLQLPSVLARFTPPEIAAVLNQEGIKNRVVIVSACYSGIFAKPLVNDNTIVLTASDEKHTSFGCAPGRDWTYFGDAFFNQSLKPGSDFKRAFDKAKILIEGWEKLDKFTPSNPQAYFGGALVQKLAPLFAAANQTGQ